MKNKFIRVFTLAVCCVMFVLAAAGCGNSAEYKAMAAAFEKVSSATKIVKTIEVANNGALLRSVKEEYTKNQSGYELIVTTSVRNPIGSEENFTTSVSEASQIASDKADFGKFPSESIFSDTLYKTADGETLLIATIPSSKLKEAGIDDSSKISGNVTFVSSIKNGSFSQLKLRYVSENQNQVVITYDYSF